MEFKNIKIPYGRSSINCKIEEENLKGVLELTNYTNNENVCERKIVEEALNNPINSLQLSEIAKGKKSAVIVTNDHTRAMRSMISLTLLLEEIRTNNPGIEVSILIATGLHRATTEEELREMFGDKIVDEEEIIVHDAFKDEEMIEVGILPSGATLSVNKRIIETDLIVTEGFIEPHFFAGFSGGRKSILPGVCSYKTVVANHSYGFLEDEYSTGGELERNIVNIDMVEAARMVKVGFTLNVVLDEDKKIQKAFAGDIIDSHKLGCEYVYEMSKLEKLKGDIVITGNGGYPLDQNIYQTPKAVKTAYECCEKGAIIIMCAECEDGIGGDKFEEIMKMGTPKEVDEYLSKIEAEDTIPEQWCAQIYSKLMIDHKIILVTDKLEKEIVEALNLLHANTIDEALLMAYKEKGRDASVVVIPDGVRVIV